uniref:Annexin n=1 Tax=Acrobeloides nanus TaxID=290746 RepID=A0A914DUG3_9BILA
MNLKGILSDVVSNAVKQHISGGNQNRQQQPSGNTSGNSSGGYQPSPAGQSSGYSSGPGGYDPYASQPPQQQGGYQPSSDMYNQGYGGGSGYPSSGGPGYPSGGPGYPPSGAPGYPPQGPGGYGQQPSAYAPYPLDNQQPGYPPQQYGQGGPNYPPYGQQQQNQPYPQPGSQNYPSYGGGVYPTMAMDAVAQQFHGSRPGTGPGYQQPAYGPTMNANPSLRPTPTFNANADAETLRKAMKGFGTNNQKVIQVICGRTNWERQEINKAFKVMYGKDLIKDLKSELSGDFEDLILALMEPPAVYDANQLHKAMAGLGTKESVLIEIMCSRTNAQIQSIKLAYKQIYGRDLERELIGETSGHFKRLLTSLCAGGRDESSRTDPVKANHDARALYRAGEQRLGTDESTFNAILASQNYAQLRLVFAEYQKVSNHSIEQAINAEFSGDIKDGLLAIVKTIKNRAAFFAELLYNSMRGLGTRDTDLIRIVVTRAEIDLRDIRTEYQRMYKTSLENAIAGDCSGNYKEGLIALVKGNY